ncbi:hypothetical protein [Chryseobacterium sediminis]|uniref:hypothetical protein n=1 Tax=Chryseobacterium sediminis TaxID=1679494 RepID=UPI00142F1255|nr:hypothetical protein [Chryseobacterium sediminis]
MKKLQKMSMNVMKNNMSRNEMRVIKAGSGPTSCNCNAVMCLSNGSMTAYCGPSGVICC